jgi:hypothetical protein
LNPSLTPPSDLYGPWDVSGYQVQVDFGTGVRLVASRRGKRLRALPALVRESEEMAWIQRVLEAARQHHRDLKALLENAMVEGIPLGAEDVTALTLDPAGRAMLEGLLVEGAGLVGRPLPEDGALETLRGDLARLETPARVVHPLTLRRSGTLPEWQRWLSRRWVEQPFKQIRRELYLPDGDDLRSRTFSNRLAGIVVRWDQARALLEGRGWYRVTKSAGERVFRRAKLTAHLEFRTPASRGFSQEDVMLNRIYFLPAGEQVVNRAHPGIPLDRVHAVAFSEALRDADLVAKVASRGESC